MALGERVAAALYGKLMTVTAPSVGVPGGRCPLIFYSFVASQKRMLSVLSNLGHESRVSNLAALGSRGLLTVKRGAASGSSLIYPTRGPDENSPQRELTGCLIASLGNVLSKRLQVGTPLNYLINLKRTCFRLQIILVLIGCIICIVTAVTVIRTFCVLQ